MENKRKNSFRKEENRNKKPYNSSKKRSSRGERRERPQKVKTYDLKNLRENQIVGVYAQGKWEYGFVDVEGIDKGFFIFGRNANGALPGDKVLAETKEFNGKIEATITDIIERRTDPVVGIYRWVKKDGKPARFGFVVPQNKDFKQDFFVAGRNSKDAKDGELVAIEIVNSDGRKPEGKVIKVLGNPEKKWVDIMAIAMEAGARMWFGWALRDELEQMTKKITASDRKKRRDLNDLLTITIDGPDSKDLDDAISITTDGNNYTLYVHIADVTHYVRENHAIDKEARRRATSIYLVDQVIPMLPEELSNGLCSLNPNEEKVTLTCEITVNNAGHIMKTDVYESIIESNFRMTYKEVDEVLEKKLNISDELMFGWTISKELKTLLENCEWLRSTLSDNKHSKWVLDFDFPETKIILDEDGNPVEFKRYERYNSNKIIEECMVLANEAVSEKYSKIPFLYRIHPVPSDDDIEKLRTSLALFSITLPQAEKTKTLHIQKALEQIVWNPKEKLLSKMVLRSLTKAEYSEERKGHFGLWLDYYSHFTSPIRRYPDLQIHRIIKENISKKFDTHRKSHYENALPKIAVHSSTQERKAEKLEYKIRDLMACKFMQSKIGETFSANISGIIEKWVFVELENTIEGFVELNDRFLGNDYDFFPDAMELVHKKTKQKFQIGDFIEVTLRKVDLEMLRIDFELSEK